MNNIGIVGLGFVGNAVFEGMKHAFSIVGYDKIKGMKETRKQPYMEDIYAEQTQSDGLEAVVKNTDGPIFICVPTPMRSDGSCDVTIVENVVRSLNDIVSNVGSKKKVIVIKSTVIPGTTEKLDQECENIHVCFNPEFLTERSAVEDFKNQDRIIIGGPRQGTNVLKQVYATAYPDVSVTKTSSTIAELVKYTTNCFLATKVAVANEIEQISRALGVDYDKVVEYATKDKRLGLSHWAVPGPDGKKGFGGKCFCKDLNGLMVLAENLGLKADVLQGAWASNLKVRPERDWEAIDGVVS